MNQPSRIITPISHPAYHWHHKQEWEHSSSSKLHLHNQRIASKSASWTKWKDVTAGDAGRGRYGRPYGSEIPTAVFSIIAFCFVFVMFWDTGGFVFFFCFFDTTNVWCFKFVIHQYSYDPNSTQCSKSHGMHLNNPLWLAHN